MRQANQFYRNGVGVPGRPRRRATVATVYNFAGGTTSEANPWYVRLVQGTDGQLYGATYNGGSHGMGTAFKVTTAGVFTLLHSFAGGASDGANPTGGLTLGSDGNFYGTTQQGGSGSERRNFQDDDRGCGHCAAYV